MKCIKHGDAIKRVSDQIAQEHVKGDWSYCSKSEWKALHRDAINKPKKAAKKKAKKAKKAKKED